MPHQNYKLIYFNGRGRAELPRLLFAYAGVEYEDYRMSSRDEFLEKYKPVLPTGMLPVLEVDGKQYPETAAIVRYLAREFKLYGKDNLEALQIDGFLEIIDNIRPILSALFSEQDEAKKEELKKKAHEEEVPAVLTLLEKLAEGDVFVTSSITVADIAFFGTMEVVMALLDSTILEKFPQLNTIYNKVEKEANIADWLAKRPVTPW